MTKFTTTDSRAAEGIYHQNSEDCDEHNTYERNSVSILPRRHDYHGEENRMLRERQIMNGTSNKIRMGTEHEGGGNESHSVKNSEIPGIQDRFKEDDNKPTERQNQKHAGPEKYTERKCNSSETRVHNREIKRMWTSNLADQDKITLTPNRFNTTAHVQPMGGPDDTCNKRTGRTELVDS
jgi:hypothetical protein